MKMIRAGRVAPVLAAALGAAACNDNLTDINVNPNQPTTAPAPYVLSNGQAAAVNRVLGDNFHLTLTALWSQHFAKIQYIDEDRYDLRPATVDAHWTGFYAGPLRDFAEVVRQGTEQNKPNWIAIGNINSVWTWHIMTDVWGDIPYSQALQGAVEDGNVVTPEYDTQAVIYTDLIARLATAQGQLTASGESFGSSDVINGGSTDLWQRTANSMRLRLAMRLLNRNAPAARAAFEAAAGLPLISTNAQNADLDYGTESVSANPIYKVRYEGGRLDHGVSKTVVDSLLRLQDPRLRVYADVIGSRSACSGSGCVSSLDSITRLGQLPPLNNAWYNGQQNGITGAAANVPTISLIGQYFYRANREAVLFSAAETYFLLAEAKQLGWNVAGAVTADSLYRQGIRLSMQQVGITDDAVINAYLAQGGVALTGVNAENLRRIRFQKWIALYGNGPEAYAEWRRHGTPGLTAGPGSVNGTVIPVRVPYPTSEQSLNAANLGEAVSRNGGLTLNQPVWWDN